MLNDNTTHMEAEMTFQKSPMLEAIDLVRTDVNSLTLEELEELSDRVMKTLFALHALRNARGRGTSTETSAVNYRLAKLEALGARLAGMRLLAGARTLPLTESIGATNKPATNSPT